MEDNMIFEEKTQTPVALKHFKTSESIGNIATALSQFQGEVQNPANIANNPFFKSKYAPLAEVLNTVRPVLAKYGLSVIQNTHNSDDKVYVHTLLMHKSGEWIESDPLELKVEKNTPQGVGSAITYGRRYALSAITGVASEEDDDGNANEPDKNKKGKKEEVPEAFTDPKVAEELNVLIGQIDVLVNELVKDETKKKTMIDIILEHNNKNKNYKKIQEVEVAKKVLDGLTKLKGE